jgi:Rha family phage regulatory protein
VPSEQCRYRAAFEKAHRHVVRAIDQLIDNLEQRWQCANFGTLRFATRRNRRQRAYEMDRDGFSLLAMGFTGPKALEWKLKFLDAFRRMEEALSEQPGRQRQWPGEAAPAAADGRGPRRAVEGPRAGPADEGA